MSKKKLLISIRRRLPSFHHKPLEFSASKSETSKEDGEEKIILFLLQPLSEGNLSVASWLPRMASLSRGTFFFQMVLNSTLPLSGTFCAHRDKNYPIVMVSQIITLITNNCGLKVSL